MKLINFVEMSVICGGCEEAVEAVLETTEVVVAPVFKILPVVLEIAEEVVAEEEAAV